MPALGVGIHTAAGLIATATGLAVLITVAVGLGTARRAVCWAATAGTAPIARNTSVIATFLPRNSNPQREENVLYETYRWGPNAP